MFSGSQSIFIVLVVAIILIAIVLKKFNSNTDIADRQNNSSNMLSMIIKIIGYLTIVCGVGSGIYLGNQGYSFTYEIFLIYSISGVISGVLFIGFSKVIRLLDNIYEELKGQQKEYEAGKKLYLFSSIFNNQLLSGCGKKKEK